LDENTRGLLKGKGKFVLMLKKYRFFFDVRTSDIGMVDVKLRDDVNHPKRGAADAKYMMTDVGDQRTYTVRPEFITSMESIEVFQETVSVKPQQAPPAIHVRMEERVPVVDRLKTLIPSQFTMIEEVEEKVPEDVLFHPYFDCQGGLPAIASKFPELFQVVDGLIRLRPPHIAPLATNDTALEKSSLPTVAEKVMKVVCATDIPQWVSITSIYEMLSLEEKRMIKKEFKSFAGFLRAHGASVSISQDTLKVSKWIPPTRRASAAPTPTAAAPPATSTPGTSTGTASMEKLYTPTHVINELFDRFPRNKTLSLPQVLELIPYDMRASVPKRVVLWLRGSSSYFVVENPDEMVPQNVRVRRATDTVPLDIAQALYPFIPEEGISRQRLLQVLPEATQELVNRLELENVVQSLSEYLELIDGDVFRKKTETELEVAIQTEESKLCGDDAEDGEALPSQADDSMEARYSKPLRYEGTISTGSGGNRRVK
jgi:hypothetical protein